MKKYFFILAMLIGLPGLVVAQKYAYVNGGNLLEAMALKQKLDESLSNFQAPLITKGEEMLAAIKQKEAKLYEEVEGGLLSQIAIQKRQEELYAEAKKFEDYEKETAAKIAEKRKSLLDPLLATVQAAIDDVAKEGGYTAVFDESMISGLLFADSAYDIGAMVKTKLGL